MGLGTELAAGWRAARLATSLQNLSRAGDDDAAERARAHLADLVGRYRGLPAKVAQWLGNAPSATGPATPTTLAPLPLSDLLPVLEAEWPDWTGYLAEIDPCGQAASLGQVHRCRTHDGRELAVKIRYPGVAERITADCALLGRVPNLGPLRRWAVDLDSLVEHLRRSVAAECDYRQEAAAQTIYRQALLGDEGVLVARTDPVGCQAACLLQEWLPGAAWSAAADRSLSDRRRLAEQLLQHWLRQVWYRGRLHADPHPGNLAIRDGTDGPQIVLYDFGCLTAVPPDLPVALGRLILALRQRRTEDCLPALVALGFDADKLVHLHARIPAICRILLWPFLHDGRQELQHWRPRERLRDLLGEQRWWFRSAGRPELLLRMRSYAGLIRLLQNLDAPVDWFGCLQAAVPDLLERSNLTLPDCGQPAMPATALAEHLHICVRDQGRTTVDLHMPATVVDELEQAMGPELVARLERRGIDLDSLIADCRGRGYTPGPIFIDEHGGRQVLVELV